MKKKLIFGACAAVLIGLGLAVFFGVKRRLYIKDTYADYSQRLV